MSLRIWQATWDVRGVLLLWGEGTRESKADVAAFPIPGTPEDEYRPPHPFALDVETIEADLNALGFEAEARTEIFLQLPYDAAGPLISPRAPADEDREYESEVQLAEWRIPALELHPLEALSFLTTAFSELPTGLRLDESVEFWREAAKLLLELLARGRFLPGIVRKDGNWRAHWHILPTNPEDHQRLNVQAESMPPICRSLVLPGQRKANEPSALLEAFISEGADHLIRAFLARYSLLGDLEQDALPPRMQLQGKWLSALGSAEPIITGPEYDLLQFEQRLKRWAGSMPAVSQKHQVITSMRLVEPAPELLESKGPFEEIWKVELGLQSAGDTTQRLSAAELWAGEQGFLEHSKLTAEELEQKFLRDLGEAIQVFPELKRALAVTHPVQVHLNTEEAYNFLRQYSKLLEQQGIAVQLPSWWGEQQTKVGLELTVRSDELESNGKEGGFLAAQELLDFSWQVSIGDQSLDLDAFRELIARQTPLLTVGGRWVELQPERLKNTMRFLEQQAGREQIRFIDALRLGLGIEQEDEMLPIVQFKATGWIRRLLDAETHSLDLIEPPEEFQGELRPYQREGLSWLAFLARLGIGGCLADDMGLGKTVQFLALLSYERAQEQQNPEGERREPTLLIVPMSILANWHEEARRFAPNLKVYVHHGSNRLSGEDFLTLCRSHDLIVTTYSIVHRDYALLSAVHWGRIALDEAQNIKNPDAKQTRAVRKLAHDCMQRNEGSLCQRVALTGTPLQNHLEELWSIFDFLNPGFLGSVKEFRERFVMPIERFRNRDSSQALNRLIQPFVLRRLKTNPRIISDLPEKMEMEVLTGLTDEQAALYQAIVEQMLPQVAHSSGMHRKGLVLATITKLKQICNHPALFLKDQASLANRSGKLARLEQILEVVLAEGDRVLVFTQYAQMGHLLKPYLQERFNTDVLFLHGALSKTARDKVVNRFKSPDGPSIFILSLKAGGLGLNLTQANQVVHYDQWWNPAVEEQATDRAYRIGQKRTVQVRKFICKGTLEEKIAEMLRHKRDLAEQVVGSTKNMVTQLSVDELRNLLQLSAP